MSKKFVLVSFFLLSGCMTVPGTNRKALNLVPRSQEIKMGEEAFSQIKQKEKISSHARYNQILQRVGKRISAVADIPDFKWEFVLIESKEANAFCLPGGKVAFYTGIFPILKNEAGMAIVMGHEVAHATARHGAQRISQGLLAQGILSAVDEAFLKNSENRSLWLQGLGLGAQVGVMLPFSRSHESEADALGIIYAAKAGYQPREGPEFWKRFQSFKDGKGAPPTFLSTHPSDAARIDSLRALLPEATKHYEGSPQYDLGESF